MKALSVIVLLLYSLSVFCMGDQREWLPHALEAYDLSSLVICKIVLNEGTPYAIIRDPNGHTHRLFKNDRMGKNYGLTKEINSKEIKLEEVYEDSKGEWISRNISLKVKENNKNCSVQMPRIDR